jgi:uncharacterized protein YcbX
MAAEGEPSLASLAFSQAEFPLPHVAALHRYPVKGLSAEPLAFLDLTAADGLAHDRAYALALGTTRFDADHPVALDKGHFLMLRANEALASLRTRLDPATLVLELARDGTAPLRFDLSAPEGRHAAETFFTAFAGPAAQGGIRLVSAPGHRFTDVGKTSPAMMRAVSAINLATVRALEAATAREIHPLRFRANIHLDGIEPGAELGWVGREVRIGALRLRGAKRTRRCAAIDVNPLTAARDAQLTKAIVRAFGHPDLGVYLEVAEDGRIAVGDAVEVEESKAGLRPDPPGGKPPLDRLS